MRMPPLSRTERCSGHKRERVYSMLKLASHATERAAAAYYRGLPMVCSSRAVQFGSSRISKLKPTENTDNVSFS